MRGMLDLSTGHMPQSVPDFGNLRAAEHEHGWVVFVQPSENLECPEWLAPILTIANAVEAVVINFDCDGPQVDGLRLYDW